MMEEDYIQLKLELQTERGKYLEYATGLACGSLERIQKANCHRQNCKIIKEKIRRLELFCKN